MVNASDSVMPESWIAATGVAAFVAMEICAKREPEAEGVNVTLSVQPLF